MESNFAAIVFDMDGVLIDARDWHYEALNEALSPFGLEISREDHLKRYNGMTTQMKLDILTSENGLPRDLHPMIKKIKQDRTLRLAATFCFPNVHHLILVNRLKTLGFKIGVYTNSIRQTSEYMLRHSQILSLLDCLITNEDVRNPKPNPEGYSLTCKLLNVDPRKVLVIEDGEYGVAAALDAGCQIFRVKGPEEVNIENLSRVLKELL